MGKPVEITRKIWADHFFRLRIKYVRYSKWCEEQAQRINEESETRMAYVEYTQAGSDMAMKCQVMDANPPGPMRSNFTRTRKEVNDFHGRWGRGGSPLPVLTKKRKDNHVR